MSIDTAEQINVTRHSGGGAVKVPRWNFAFGCSSGTLTLGALPILLRQEAECLSKCYAKKFPGAFSMCYSMCYSVVHNLSSTVSLAVGSCDFFFGPATQRKGSYDILKRFILTTQHLEVLPSGVFK